MPMSWTEKARKAKPAHVVVLEKSFAGVPAGAALLIPSPELISAYMKTIPRGERRTLSALRADLARQHQADNTCPVTSAIHARIVAELTIEHLAAGAPAEALIPFWRAIEPASALAKKLSIGPQGLKQLQALES